MTATRVLNGRYQLEAEIGAGGMARVYRAADLRLGRTVAVKMLRDGFADDPDIAGRFRQEARAAGGLNHPNIVTVYDVGTDQGDEFLVMQLIAGPDLKDLIRERGRFAIPEAIQILRGVCAALDYAHRQGIIHRDVKPQNILIGADGAIKLADFGIARALGASSTSKTGEVFGTVQYLSPEQVQGQPATAASDIYAAGVVLYELLTGRVPLQGDTPVATAMLHLQAPVPSLRAVDRRFPAALDGVVARALAKDPRQRFATAGEFGRALTQLLQTGGTQSVTLPVTSGPGGAAPRIRQPGPDWPFILLAVFTTTVLLGLCALGAAIVGR